MAEVIRILGIDPGLRIAGWGLIDACGSKLGFIASGTIKPSITLSLAERLHDLHQGLGEIIEKYAPDSAAVEETFVNANPRSALLLGQARGVCLLAPAGYGLEVGEYPANTIKKAVVGAGHAQKQQIQEMIRVLLPKAGTQQADAADALAVAICHAHHSSARAILKRTVS